MIRVQLTGLLICDDSGSPWRVVATVEEVDGGGDDSTLRVVFDSPNICIIIAGEDGRIRVGNKTFEDMFGYSVQEITGQPVDRILPEQPRDEPSLDPWVRLASGSAPLARHRSGASFPVEVKVSDVTTADGLLKVVFISDVSIRRQLQAERDSFFNVSPDPLCIRSLNGNFRHVNPAMVKVLGWSEEELRSRPFIEFVHPEDRAATLAAIHGLREGKAMVDLENRNLCKDGSWRWLQWNAPAPELGTSLIYAAARDVTDVKRAEEKLRALTAQLIRAQEEERGRIARELHDNITQRLAVLAIEIGLLKQTADASVSDSLTSLQSQIHQLSEEVRELSHSFHPSMLELSGLPTSLEMHCREFGRRYRITTNFTARDVPDYLPKTVVLGLFRIAQESLHNVAKHSSAKLVTVTLTGQDTGGLRMAIMDDGCGFDVERTIPKPGLGLLSMEERARLIGGTISIRSIPGEGTTVSVTIPSLVNL